MTTETITADVASEGNSEVALAGEVITPQDVLRENERIIKRNWQKAQEKVETVYRALTIIHTNDLWKLHKDAKGKRKYTAFDQYLFGEFGWELSRVRALQIIKATRQKMIDAGELPASAAQARKRTAPDVTAEKAAKVTADQFAKVLEAFGLRINSIDEGDPDRAEIVNIYAETQDFLSSVIEDLREMVRRAEADATPAGTFPLAEVSKSADGDTDEDDDTYTEDDDTDEVAG